MSLDLKWHCFVSHTSVSKNKEAAKSLCHNKATEVALWDRDPARRLRIGTNVNQITSALHGIC